MSKKQKCCEGKVAERLGKVGGQAVLEGVMMKAGDRTVTTCRKEDGSLFVHDATFTSVRNKKPFLNIPIIRGVVNFVEMMALSLKTMSVSAEALELDDEKDKERKAKGKKTTTDMVMVVGAVLGVALSLVLFMYLPGLVSDFVEYLISRFADCTISPIVMGIVKALIEGGAKILIFISYLALVSLMPDIKRTFMYHGAEHKSIACFEAGAPLTPESAKNYTRFHPRCGTSFMFVMILLGIAVGMLVNIIFPGFNRFLLTGIRLLILPFVVGLGYEFIRFAGKHDNIVTRLLSAPGLWMQRITTKEPTEDMLEVAIISLKCSLRDDFPEFKEFYELRSWEPRPAVTENAEDGAETNTNENGNMGAEENVEEAKLSEADTEKSPHGITEAENSAVATAGENDPS